MKFLFVVQGEGRGHFMQAIEMKAMLERHGHEVVMCLVGKNPARVVPQYFYDRMQGTVVESFESPNFVQGVNGKRPSYFNSFIENIIKLPGFSLSMHRLRTTIAQVEPDAIINFYDVMVGISNYLAPMPIPIISVGHQYLFLHKDFEFPDKKSKIELDPLRLFTIATSVGSCRRLALSFYPLDDDADRDIIVVPPILRTEVRSIATTQGNYIHGYMLNSGFADEVQAWHTLHPDMEMHFFWDKPDVPDTYELQPGLTMHRINDTKFLQSMAGCGAYATTSGFESVCEALYMGKPALLVPVHIEQECNGYDAMKVGAGIVSHNFDIDRLVELMQRYKPNHEFRTWCNQAEQRIIAAIEDTVNNFDQRWYHRIIARHIFR